MCDRCFIIFLFVSSCHVSVPICHNGLSRREARKEKNMKPECDAGALTVLNETKRRKIVMKLICYRLEHNMSMLVKSYYLTKSTDPLESVRTSDVD